MYIESDAFLFSSKPACLYLSLPINIPNHHMQIIQLPRYKQSVVLTLRYLREKKQQKTKKKKKTSPCQIYFKSIGIVVKRFHLCIMSHDDNLSLSS